MSALALVIAIIVYAQAALGSPFAYIPNSGSATVSVIDTASDTVVATITGIGPRPYSAVPSPDGTRLYVSDRNGFASKVWLIDTATNAVIDAIPVFTGTLELAVSPDGKKVYALRETTVAAIDVATRAVTEIVRPNWLPLGIAFHPFEPLVYISSGTADTPVRSIVVINTTTDSVVQSVPTIIEGQIAVSPFSLRIFGADKSFFVVRQLDGATLASVGATFPLNEPHGVALRPDGQRMFAVGNLYLREFDLGTNSTVDSFLTGTSGGGLAVHPDGRAYLVDRFNDRVIVWRASPPYVRFIPVGDEAYARGNFLGPTICGNGVVEGDEQCDDANTIGGDGCATNCTNESARVLLTDVSQSAAALHNSSGTFPFTRTADLPIIIGGRRPSDPRGIVPITVREAAVAHEQLAVPGLGCLCIRGEPHPSFGPDNAGMGSVGCGPSNIPGVDLATTLDHNIGDQDPSCSTGVAEQGGDPHPGVCNGRAQVEIAELGPPGAFRITLNTAAHFIPDDGTCTDDLTNPLKGADGIACSSDDPGPIATAEQQITSGRAAGAVLDANNIPAAAIPPGIVCGTSVCFVEEFGDPIDCAALLAPGATTLRTGTRASVLPLLHFADGDALISSRLEAPPSFTPTSTATPTVTPTATSTWTRSSTFTPSRTRTPSSTRTFTMTPSVTSTPTSTGTATAAPAPNSLVLRKVRLKGNTSTRPNKSNGSASVRGLLNANPPFDGLESDIAATGVTLRIAGAGGVEMTFAWPASACSVDGSPRGPRIRCEATDTGGLRKLQLRPTTTPNAYAVRFTGKRLGWVGPSNSAPVRVVIATRQFKRQDDIYTCALSGPSMRTSTCIESGIVPTPTPAPPLGERVFSIARPGSALFSSIVPGLDVSGDPWLPATLHLQAGVPDVDGVASLTLAQDAIVGLHVASNQILCMKIFAAASHGSIDCDGGTPYDILSTWDSNGAGPPGAFEIYPGLGSDAGPGGATLFAGWVAYLLNAPSPVTECLTLGYGTPSFLDTFTTATSTGAFINPIQGGTVEVSAHGQNFDCATWSQENSAGRLLTPIIATDTIVGDLANMLALSDPPATQPPVAPTITPTATP